MSPVALFLLVMALRTEPLRAVSLRTERLRLGAVAAAFGVFGGFQIANFDVFLVFHYLALLFWIVTFLCYLSRTEQQQLTPPATDDILLRDQIVKTDQFLFLALLPSTC
jgi:hypothetical protein